MKYFIDTEFLEGTQTKRVLGFNTGQTKPTIDLISIGIMAEDGREYYAISKEFNLKEAWNMCQEKVNPNFKTSFGDHNEGYYNPRYIKEYWLRENVLKPIFQEILYRGHKEAKMELPIVDDSQFTYKNLKRLIKHFGKTNAQIAEEVKSFVNGIGEDISVGFGKHQFYGYYADYDWVVFCWLFGKMIDLPDGFPMYCNDLKQVLETQGFGCNGTTIPLEMWGKDISEHPLYPKQTNEHNALADARWNKKLYEFLKSL